MVATTSKCMVGDFELQKQLGHGSYGKVYLGVSKNHGAIHKVAIKMLEPKKIESAVKEINMLTLCQHEHVLPIQAFDFNDQSCVMVLDLMKQSLDSVKGRFTFAQVKRLMKQLLQAVATCHQRSVCHLDIKPGNILLDAHNNVKLADFGISVQSTGPYIQGVSFSPRYRPPEVILGDYYDGYKADVWAVGLVFAFLLLKNQHLLPVRKNDRMLILEETCSVFGKPDEKTWPGVSLMKNYHLLERVTADGPGLASTIKSRHSAPPKAALELLEQMLTLDPHFVND